MKTKKIFNIMLCCVLIIISMPFSVSAEESQSTVQFPDSVEYVPGEIVLTTSDELIDSSSKFVTYGTNDDCTLINFESTEINNAKELNTCDKLSDERTYVVDVEGDILEKCEELKKLPGVLYAEPNMVFHTMEFSMPQEITEGALYAEHMKWYFDLMKIPETWQNFETTGKNVVVAVIDNGYKLDATDFPPNLWTDTNGNHGWNTYKNSADISPIYKSDGTAFNNSDHGTHIAGIIGGLMDGKNIIGASYDAELMLINAAHYENDTDLPSFFLDDLLEAIDYARVNGADIINMSLGLLGGQSAQLENYVNKAYNDGVAVIAAAGNSGVSTEQAKAIPAAYENVIGVMASDKTDPTQLAYFSNYDPSGVYYDVVAPGYEILSCSIVSNKVAYGSGTSQACPLVTACAALYMQEYPNATIDELYEALREAPKTEITSNSETTPDATYTFRLLDAYSLLEYGKVDPDIRLNLNTNITRDESLGYIWGLDEKYTDIHNYITVTEGTGTLEFIPSECGTGTGSVVNIYDIYGSLVKTYTIIIFGDVNGDAVADGQDAVLISYIMNSDTFTDPQKFASDVDFDGMTTEYDYSITANYALLLDYIFQTR